MAKIIKEMILENAVIDASDQTITEYVKDGVVTYTMQELMEQWDGVAHVSLTIRQVISMPPDAEVNI